MESCLQKSRTRLQGVAYAACVAGFLSLCGPLSAQTQSATQRQSKYFPELGFWIGASNPVPGTALDQVLDPNIGGGFFMRFRWPWVFHTEFGFSYAHYGSRTTDSLNLLPVYGALNYQLPLPFRLQVFLKLGGGMAQVEVRPVNKIGWDPLVYAGLEFSIQAARSFRVGLRIDYNLVHEGKRNRQTAEEILFVGGTTDPRYMSNRTFNATDGRFFNFGLMMSFYL